MYRALAVTSNRVRDYIGHRQKEGAAAATINRELEGLQRAFALAADSGVITSIPKFSSLPERNAREGFFERGEFYAVLEKLKSADVKDYLEWFYWTGMRPGEIRSLTWKAFDRETSTLRLHAKDAKSGHGRAISVAGPLQKIIQRRMTLRMFACDLIFHRSGKPVGDFSKQWKSACKAAGVAGKLPYDLRRTAVRNMIRAGVPERVAMLQSGHRTRQMLDRYNIVSENDLREAVLKTAQYVESLSLTPTVVQMPSASGTR
jgi:integrase